MSDGRGWWRVALLLFVVGWGANHVAPLLILYRHTLVLDATDTALLFGMYALGLMPGLLVAGPLSDRRSRRGVVLVAASGALLASAVLGAFGASFVALVLGRFLYGLAAGAVMTAGAVWLLELSAFTASGVGPRRATIALSAGFGLGPALSGLLAQYLPYPSLLPYVVHVIALLVALAVARAARDPDRPGPPRTGPLLRFGIARETWRAFWCGVAPMAPFVFAFPTIAFAGLPSTLEGALGDAPMAYTGLLCALTLAAGVLAQPLTKRLSPAAGARVGLIVGAVATLVGAVTVATQTAPLLLVVAPMLGASYGLCMTSGLRAVERIAPAHARGALTGLYYVLTYVGFAAPYALALASHLVRPEVALVCTAVVATLVALTLRDRSAPASPSPRA